MTGIPGKEHKGGFPCPFGGKFKPRVGNVPCLSDINCIQKIERGGGSYVKIHIASVHEGTKPKAFRN